MERLRTLLADRDFFKGGTFLEFEPLPFLLDPELLIKCIILSSPPETVPVLPSEEVPQDGHEARRWVPIHRSIHPQHHALFTPLPPLPPNTSTSYFHSLEPSFCYYYYFYYYYCYSAGSSGRWVMVLSDSVWHNSTKDDHFWVGIAFFPHSVTSSQKENLGSLTHWGGWVQRFFFSLLRFQLTPFSYKRGRPSKLKVDQIAIIHFLHAYLNATSSGFFCKL